MTIVLRRQLRVCDFGSLSLRSVGPFGSFSLRIHQANEDVLEFDHDEEHDAAEQQPFPDPERQAFTAGKMLCMKGA